MQEPLILDEMAIKAWQVQWQQHQHCYFQGSVNSMATTNNVATSCGMLTTFVSDAQVRVMPGTVVLALHRG